jgi:hypothetical protein
VDAEERVKADAVVKLIFPKEQVVNVDVDEPDRINKLFASNAFVDVFVHSVFVITIVPPLTHTRGNPTDPPVNTNPHLLNVRVPPAEEISGEAEPIDVPNEREMSLNVNNASFTIPAPEPVRVLEKEKIIFVPTAFDCTVVPESVRVVAEDASPVRDKTFPVDPERCDAPTFTEVHG